MKSCLYCGTTDWKPHTEFVGPDPHLLTCANCGTNACAEFVNAPILPAGMAAGMELANQFANDPAFQPILALLQRAIPLPQTRLERVVGKILPGAVDQMMKTATWRVDVLVAKRIVKFARALEKEMDAHPETAVGDSP